MLALVTFRYRNAYAKGGELLAQSWTRRNYNCHFHGGAL